MENTSHFWITVYDPKLQVKYPNIEGIPQEVVVLLIKEGLILIDESQTTSSLEAPITHATKTGLLTVTFSKALITPT